jgi:alpha-glucosidase (family GH31 glycosyl hydrolase)
MKFARTAATVIALLGVAAPEGARAETLTTAPGTLRAQLETDPWRLSFVDGAGRTVLAEGGEGLGFRVSGGWVRAVRALDARVEGDAIVARAETDDPLGRTLEVRAAPEADGVVAVSAQLAGGGGHSAIGIGFAARPGERYLGFGERANAVDQRGRVVESYVADGPYQRGAESQAIRAFVPGPGFRDRDDATYFPMPWLVSTAGYGVLVDNTETAYHRLDAPDAWSVEVTSAPDGGELGSAPGRLALRVFAGPGPADVVRRLTERLGRQPRAAAPWVFGAWFQPGGSTEEQVAQLERQRAADVPVSVMQTYTHYLPCGDHRDRREAERERLAAFHARGTAVTTYFNPMICESYQPAFGEAAAAGALLRRRDGSVYTYRYSSSPTNHFPVSQFDFSAAAGRDFYARLLEEAIEDGHDGWMEDFGEYTPLDSRSANGMDGTEMHNLHPVQYHCAAYEVVRRQRRPIVRFQRSGFTGAARCAQVVWSGDPTTSWGFDGLASQVTAGLTMGLSGVSTWGSDIGGFFALGQNSLSPELLQRWVQFGAVSPVMRTQRNGVAVPSRQRPQVEHDGQIANWRRWAKLHTQLYPYLVAAEREYRATGMPIMRHLALAEPGDPEAVARDDEFLFGPDLLAAPVVAEGARERTLYLPRGTWVDLWRSARYDEPSGGIELGRARLARGGRELTVPAPLEELPLLVRAGAVLPLLPRDVDTLARGGEGLVALGDRRGRIELLAFPRGATRSELLAGERLVSRERRGEWRLRVEGRRTRRYELQASLATLRRPLRPCGVALGGRALPRRAWRWDRRARVLRASFRARRATLVVRGC